MWFSKDVVIVVIKNRNVGNKRSALKVFCKKLGRHLRVGPPLHWHEPGTPDTSRRLDGGIDHKKFLIDQETCKYFFIFNP